MRSSLKWNLILIAVLAVFCFSIVFPHYVNYVLSLVNAGMRTVLGQETTLQLPYIPQIDFKLGLDLQGGTRLIYEADLTRVASQDRKEAMAGLRGVIERRINLFGVSEPLVNTQEVAGISRLNVELAGVKDVNQAIEMIGKTPLLEFREEKSKEEIEAIQNRYKDLEPQASAQNQASLYAQMAQEIYSPTKLTGQYLKRASLDFSQNSFEPQVGLEFNSEGAKIFEELTDRNVGKRIAIFIDGAPISEPRVNEKISGGKAQITGKFTETEARNLVRNLNAGALPVPIKLISQTTVGPTLGAVSLNKSLAAGLYGFLAVVIFMIIFYRFSGFFASLALVIYSLILLSLFKLIPVTLTLAGIGGAILSVGMAVDANVLIFARLKEERQKGDTFAKALEASFTRAWPSIRDSNFTTILIAVIMFFFGTSFVKGFAFTLTLGILVSMFSALFITKSFMRVFIATKLEKLDWLWGSK
jgi:protein-export membrane protein SecD